MAATPEVLNHLRNSTIATFFFTLLLLGTVSAYLGLMTSTASSPEEGQRRQIAIDVLTAVNMAETFMLFLCVFITFGFAMQIPRQ
jgi:vacuolar-type H+-ATPase subunit I/STV1